MLMLGVAGHVRVDQAHEKAIAVLHLLRGLSRAQQRRVLERAMGLLEKAMVLLER